MGKAHNIQHVSLSGTVMRLRVDGEDYQIDIAGESQRLRNATQEQRENFEVSPSGYGIHWPDVDEDLSVDGLIGVKHAPPIAVAEA
jgi:hypothetical protein